jgi:hypothetical protein
MVKLIRRSLIAFLVGAVLGWAVPVLIALVAAAPGLATLIRSIKAAGLSVPPVYFGLTNFLPALLLAFGVGFAMFRVLGGKRVELLVASAAPWVLSALYFYAELCLGTSVSCTGPFELVGLAVVPLGLLLAALVSGPPSLNMSYMDSPLKARN